MGVMEKGQGIPSVECNAALTMQCSSDYATHLSQQGFSA